MELRSTFFTVTHDDRSYEVEADPGASHELVWLSQKCWFMPGSVVIITDEQGNSQTFVKE